MSAEPFYVDSVYDHALDLIDQHPDLTSVGIAWGEDGDGGPVACATGCVVTMPDTLEPITPDMLNRDGAEELVVLASIRAITCARGILGDFLAIPTDGPNS